MTFDLSPHTIKAGANIRLGRGTDDRTGVAGAAIELAYNFSRTVNNNFALPGWTALPTGATVINTADRTRLENMINDLLGRVGNINQAFVNDPNNPGAFAQPGTRWLFEADHPELDFYVQDSWRWRPNFLVDLGLRWEMRLTPESKGGRPILVPNQPFVLGAPATNNLRWEEGELFENKYALILPTVGFAWDPFKTGKTSIRANYRKASDRFGTFMYSSFIFQSAPGNTFAGSNTAFGQNGGLLRNGLPSVAPTGSPASLRTPPAFSTNSTTVIDPDLKFPSIHNWTVSFQREVFGGNVLEVNYIGKKATNLLGTYNVNQVNLNRTLPGINETFLQAFNSIRDNPTYVSPLINFLLTGNAATNIPAINTAGTTFFRNLNATALTQGSVATLALALSQRLCLQADINAGRCAAQDLNQQLLGARGNGTFFQPFTQFTGGLFVIDSNDYSFYNGVEVTFRRRMRNGLSYNVGYTWALSKDSRSFDPTFTTISTTGTTGPNTQTAGNYPVDSFNRRLNYAWSDFDRRHSLLGTYVYELPFGRGKAFGSGAGSALNYLISGWQIAGTVRITSGRPFTAYSSLFTLNQNNGSYANCNGCPRNMGNVVQGNFENTANPLLRNWWWTPEQRALFTQPNPGEIGNTGRNYFIGPRYFETDLSLSRKFRFNERFSFDLRADARNLLNTVNFAAPTATMPAGFSTGAPPNSFGTSIFGRINADVTNSARRVQLSGRLNF